jgi:sec-independent protein translocase protein TatA
MRYYIMGSGTMQLAFISNIGPWEMALVFLIVMVIFGADRVPKIARDLGKGINEFKKSLSGESEEKKDESKKD